LALVAFFEIPEECTYVPNYPFQRLFNNNGNVEAESPTRQEDAGGGVFVDVLDDNQQRHRGKLPFFSRRDQYIGEFLIDALPHCTVGDDPQDPSVERHFCPGQNYVLRYPVELGDGPEPPIPGGLDGACRWKAFGEYGIFGTVNQYVCNFGQALLYDITVFFGHEPENSGFPFSASGSGTTMMDPACVGVGGVAGICTSHINSSASHEAQLTGSVSEGQVDGNGNPVVLAVCGATAIVCVTCDFCGGSPGNEFPGTSCVQGNASSGFGPTAFRNDTCNLFSTRRAIARTFSTVGTVILPENWGSGLSEDPNNPGSYLYGPPGDQSQAVFPPGFDPTTAPGFGT
jgi:hypothetical protein